MTTLYNDQLNEYEKLIRLGKKLDVEIESVFSLSNNCKLNDNILFSIARYIRTEWIKKVSDHCSNYDISPWEGQIPLDVNNKKMKYCYESLIDDREYSKEYAIKINNYMSQSFFYRNGMSAIRGVLCTLKTLLSEELSILYNIGYFESRYLLKLFYKNSLNLSEYKGEDNDFNVIFMELILYNKNLELTDINKVISAIEKSNKERIYVIIDSTLTPCTAQLIDIISKKTCKNIVFIDIRSMIKFDQQGLELCNGGVANWYFEKEDEDFAEFCSEYIIRLKGILGENILFRDMCLMSRFNIKDTFGYYQSVISMSSIMFDEISNNNIFNELYWNEESDVLKIKSPFLMASLNNNRKEDYESFIRNTVKKFSNEGLFLPFRNSFGYRSPSIETYEDVFTKNWIIKIYPGSYNSYLLNELCKYLIKEE